MAEHDLKLVISADTTDAENKIKDVGKTKVRPVKVDVTAEKVKIDAPKVDPVKVPVTVDATSSSRQIKDVVDSISDATRTSRPQIKPEVVVETTGFGAIQQQILGIRSAISKALLAFGTIGMAVGIVMSVVNAFKLLKDKIEETSKSISKIRFDAEMRSATAETNSLVSAHERLSRVLKDELDTMSKQKTVGDIKKNAQRDLEDGRRTSDRARQIYEAKTPEEEQALRDRFAREDAEIATKRRKEDRRGRINELDEEESAYTSKANGLKEKQKQTDEQLKVEEMNVRRARGSRKDGEEMSQAEKDAVARVESLKKAKEANDLAIATYEKEAKFRRDQIAALEAIQDANGADAVDLQQKQLEKEKSRENDKATTKADSEWKERQKRDKEKKDVEEAIDIAQTSGDKKAILDAQANNKRVEANELRQQYEDEMAKDPSVRNAEKLDGLRQKIDELENDAEAYKKRGKDISKDESKRREADRESFSERIASAEGVSQNRLTAMGLGAGVSSKGDVSSDVKKLVDLMRDQIAATREGNEKSGKESAAVYSD